LFGERSWCCNGMPLLSSSVDSEYPTFESGTTPGVMG
jgi:hypothetical protein